MLSIYAFHRLIAVNLQHCLGLYNIHGLKGINLWTHFASEIMKDNQ
jgi:hypothetical protein